MGNWGLDLDGRGPSCTRYLFVATCCNQPFMGSHLTNLAAALTQKVKVTIPPNGGDTTCGAMVASEASMEHPHDAASPVAWMMT